jgi:parvulin-like peptidyl-prolyl isomerase
MKQRTKRAASALLSFTMLAGMLTGCGGSDEPAPGLTVDGQTVDAPYVLTIDGEQVSFDLYRYYYLNLKNSLDKGDESYWEDNAEGEKALKDETLKYVKAVYAVRKLAEQNGLALTEEDKQQVSSEIAGQVESAGEAEYQQALKDSFMTDELNRSTAELSLLQNKLRALEKYNFTEEAMRKLIDEEFIRASHILVLFDTDGTETKKKKAETALYRAKAGEDFDTLVKEYGEDSGMKDNTDGYYFTKGMMVQSFEDAAYALKEGEISDIVESNYGYHIIKRLPKEQSYIDENIDTITSSYESFLINRDIDEAVNALKVEYGEHYDQIGPATLH